MHIILLRWQFWRQSQQLGGTKSSHKHTCHTHTYKNTETLKRNLHSKLLTTRLPTPLLFKRPTVCMAVEASSSYTPFLRTTNLDSPTTLRQAFDPFASVALAVICGRNFTGRLCHCRHRRCVVLRRTNFRKMVAVVWRQCFLTDFIYN